MKIRVIIAGSRYFDDYEKFCRVTEPYLRTMQAGHELIVLSGHCAGADALGERYAAEHGLSVEYYPPDWERYGKAAGPVRNRQMVEAADCVLAFSAGGRGTESLLALAQKKGIPVNEYRVEIL